MSDLTDLRASVFSLLRDSAKQVFSDDEVDQAIRMALLDYSEALPKTGAAVLTLASDGPEVDLSGLPPFQSVVRLYWPWDADLPYGRQVPNRVLGWETYTNGGSAWALLTVRGNEIPPAGSRVRLHYTLAHAIAGLNGAEQTSLPASHLDLLGRGAAGYAFLCRAADVGDVLDKALCERLGGSLLDSFRSMLADLAANAQRAGSAILQWRAMDKYDPIAL